MFNIYFTNPASDMLLGFETQEVKIVDTSVEDAQPKIGTMFSVGGFIFRMDIIFNLTPLEDES